MMRFSTVLLQTAVAVLLRGVGARAVLELDLRNDVQNNFACPSSGSIERELRPRLSAEAAILVPSSPDWAQLMLRASSPRIDPVFLASVQPATEEDVQETIKYANHIGAPFLAVTGTHGWPTTLNNLRGGIQINMRKMNDTRVNKDGKTATVGGGVMQYEIVQSLYEQGKLAVTGLCGCVSVAGPLLGGGHSMMQGRHGFSVDNLVSARLVIANGTAITVSAVENPDLFWAIRGAGHNFGIVTSLDVKVYDAAEKWTLVSFAFTQDKLERYFETWNRLEAEHDDPGLLVLNGLFARNPAIDVDHAFINLELIYEGENSVAEEYKSAFLALGPVSNSTVSGIEYKDIHDVGGFGLASPVCRKNENLLGYPNSFARWDVDGMRAGFNLFSELTADEKFATSAWILESYGKGGVQAVPVTENAVAPEERLLHLLTSPILWWVGDDDQDRRTAVSYGERIQMAVRGNTSSLPHAYINYAVGTEQLPEVYGRDGARLARLKYLKGIYDPHNRFGFYNPL